MAARVSINRNDLKSLLKETIIEVLNERRDIFEDAVLEALEDMGLARAIEEGDTGQCVTEEIILKTLDQSK